MNTTPTLSLPLRGRERFFPTEGEGTIFSTEERKNISFPLRGKVGKGVVHMPSVSSVAELRVLK
jgi:hypothetical protein